MTLGLLKVAVLASASAGLVLLAWLAVQPRWGLHQRVAAHVDDLDARLRLLLMPARGRTIAAGQAFASALVGAFAALLLQPWALLALLVPVATPRWALAWMRHRRRARLETSAGSFAVSVANALQANPNLGQALATAAGAMPEPLRGELELTLRDLRLGSTTDEALTALGMRVDSPSFDAVLGAILLGGRVGGDLSAILRDTASSLREMERLRAVLRTKTADGRIQGVVLGVFPGLLVVGFDALMPGYFSPLMTTAVGALVVLCAGAAWLIAVVLTRQILAVEL